MESSEVLALPNYDSKRDKHVTYLLKEVESHWTNEFTGQNHWAL